MLSTTLIDPVIQARANTSVEWLGTDRLYNYKYPYPDIEYKFNSHGFRCDEFELLSELPMVFLGCSFTEGIGLRQHETWSYLLLEKIRQKTNKNIPYWNLSLAGTGIDTQARNLYFLSNILNKKIKFVFSLMPPITRREYKATNDKYQNWSRQIKNFTPLSTHVNTLFADSDFSIHQTERSLMTIDSICRQNDAKICCTFWNSLLNSEKPVFDSFPLIDIFQLNFWPSAVRPNIARDGLHPGPLYHQKLADTYWQHVEKYFIDISNT